MASTTTRAGEKRVIRLVTNPGSNLSPELIAHYDVVVTSQLVVVDGVEHDTRKGIPNTQIDEWVSTSEVHPYVVGTTAAEHVGDLRKIVRSGEQALVITTSKKIIKTYDAAQSAARSVMDAVPGSVIEAVDTGVTDAGAGLGVILAGQAIAAGETLGTTISLIDGYREHAHFIFTMDSLDYAVRGGRATAVRAFFANLLRIRPVLGFADGELAVAGKRRAGSSKGESLLSTLAERIPEGERVWATIFHGDVHEEANELADRLREQYDVAFLYSRVLSPSIYLHSGHGSLGLCAVPAAKLPFDPPAPPFT